MHKTVSRIAAIPFAAAGVYGLPSAGKAGKMEVLPHIV